MREGRPSGLVAALLSVGAGLTPIGIGGAVLYALGPPDPNHVHIAEGTVMVLTTAVAAFAGIWAPEWYLNRWYREPPPNQQCPC